MRYFFRLLFLLSLVYGQEGKAESKVRRADVTLLSSVQGVGKEKSIILGLHFKMKNGWHTYWRSPGPTGYPTKLDWSGSQNIDTTELYWPVPERFKVQGIAAVGYVSDVVLPIMVKLKERGKALKISLKADYLVCSESRCVPEDISLEMIIPDAPSLATASSEIIGQFLRRVPKISSKGTLKIDPLFTLDASSPQGDVLSFKATKETPFKNVKAYLESDITFYHEKPTIALSKDGLEAVITFSVFKNEQKNKRPKKEFLTNDFLLTLADDSDVAISRITPSFSLESLSIILVVLLSAFLGGIILNVMPCVLPVLSLKIFALLKSKKEDLRTVREEFLLTTAGIIVSFWVLGVGVILLKAIGVQVGWGMQFQQPAFLMVMALILLLFTANLWDLFDVRMPQFFSRATQNSKFFSGKSQHFFMGAFVTILATPCTAPFLATAISFSLSRGAFEIFYIFTAMGLGLALPYILVVARPSIARLLPKPGRWMITLRKILGVGVFLTLIWILSVLFAQLHLSYVTLFLFSVALLVLLLIIYKTKVFLIKTVAWSVLVLSFFLVDFLPKKEVTLTVQSEKGLWKKFEQNIIPAFVSEGKVVFVDVTADWCLTCKVNEAAVLNTAKTKALFKEMGIVLMKADWTSPNQEIADFLKKHNEYAIPFYIVYGPKHPYGLKLPQILTYRIVEEALLEAGAKKTKPLSSKEGLPSEGNS